MSLPAAAQDRSVPPPADRIHTVSAEHGMVVAQEKIAAQIGGDILRQGGNAIDAAVATGFAMAVTYPRAGNIGGGGFMLIHRSTGEDVAIDYRETAPAAMTPRQLPRAGRQARRREVARLGARHRRTRHGGRTGAGAGQIRLRQVHAGATDQAGDRSRARRLRHHRRHGRHAAGLFHKRLAKWPASAKIFSRPDGTSLGEGDKLVQTDLAATLTAVAEQGPRGFYEGPVAEKLAQDVRDAGGIMTADDLKNYQPAIRTPVRGSYRGYDIVSMPQPSSGGVVLIESLNILEGFDLAALKQGSAPSLHLLIEAMKRAYADRARYLGDPAFVSAPIATLIAKDYAAKLRASIDPEHATPADKLMSAMPPREGSNTTHFSVVDSDGNAVSNTTTLNFSYGVGLVADGTGVLLNNELDDFTAAPGAANAYGLVGYEANLPGPGKRPLSSMTPTIVMKDGKPVLVTGTPGGSRIISTVLQVIVNVLDYHMDIEAAVAAPRVHHQWMPDEVSVEPGFPDDVLAELRAKGHNVVQADDLLLGQFDHGDAERTVGRARSAHPRRRSRGAIVRLCEVASVEIR